MATLIQIRRGTDAEWTSANPILSAGELALSTDLGTIKVGNGSSNWSSLEYITPIDTDDLTEGISNLYFTNSRAIIATSDAISSASAAAVASANFYTDSAVTNLIDSAPGALDTLNELAAALGDDANFATTVTNSLATKLDVSTASATYLTGNQSISITGDATGSGSTSISLTLANSGVSAATYGSASAVPSVAIDAKGRVTSASTTPIAIAQSAVTNLTTDLGLKANLSSPDLTGIPTAPTAAAGTNTTQISTTAFVQSAISIIDGGTP